MDATLIPTSVSEIVVSLKQRLHFHENAERRWRPHAADFPLEPGIYLLTTPLGGAYIGRASGQSLRSRLQGPKGSIMQNLPGARFLYTFTSALGVPFSTGVVDAAESSWLQHRGGTFCLANRNFRPSAPTVDIDQRRLVTAITTAIDEVIDREGLLHPRPRPGEASTAALHHSIVEHCGTEVPRSLVSLIAQVLESETWLAADVASAVGRNLGARGGDQFTRTRRGHYAPARVAPRQ